MSDQQRTDDRPVMTRLSDVTVTLEFLHMQVLVLKKALDEAREPLKEQTIRVKFDGSEQIGIGITGRPGSGGVMLGIFPPPIFGLCGDLDKGGLTLARDPVDVKIGQLADVAGQAAELVLVILNELALPQRPTHNVGSTTH